MSYRSPHPRLQESSVNGCLLFSVPRHEDSVDVLANYFESLEGAREELQISDVSISLTTLEEVFLRLSKADEASGKETDESDQIHVTIPEGSCVPPSILFSLDHTPRMRYPCSC